MELIQIAQNFGFAALCLIALALGVWRMGIAVFNRVCVPMVDAHKKYLESQARLSEENTEILKTNTETQAKLADTVDALRANMPTICRFTDQCGNFRPK